jgi:hypothetical protein
MNTWVITIITNLIFFSINKCTHNPWQCLMQLNLHYQFELCVAKHYNNDQLFICFLCFHMVFNNSLLFMSNVKFNLN